MNFSKNIKIVLVFNVLMIPLMSYAGSATGTGNLKISDLSNREEIENIFKNSNITYENSGLYFLDKDKIKDFNDSYQNPFFLTGDPFCKVDKDNRVHDIKVDAMRHCIESIVKEIVHSNKNLKFYKLIIRRELDYSNELDEQLHIDEDSCGTPSISYRVIVPLCGVGTEFAQLSPEQRLSLSSFYCNEGTAIKHSPSFKEQINRVVPDDQIKRVQVGQAAVFEGGNLLGGVLHKKPSTKEPRMFLILYGKPKKS